MTFLNDAQKLKEARGFLPMTYYNSMILLILCKIILPKKLCFIEGSKLIDNIFDMAKLSSEGVLEVKKSVVVESSKTSHFSSSFSSTMGGPKPHVEIKSFTSKSEASSQKVGDKPPVSVC